MTQEEHNMVSENIFECDKLIARLFEEIRGRNNALFIDSLTDSVAKLMNARAAYTTVLNIGGTNEGLDDHMS